MSQRTIVQYEVYVLAEDRWSLHARYPGAEREDALKDARRTEQMTGRPAKVVRDTYYPEENYSEEVVAYCSPNAKQKEPEVALGVSKQPFAAKTRVGKVKSKAFSSKEKPGSQQTAMNEGANARTRLKFNGPDFFTRLILSLGFSMLIAAGLTALFSMFLAGIVKLGAVIPSSMASRLMLYWYLGMFGLAAIAINRAYVPWRTLFINNPLAVLKRQKHTVEPEDYTPAPKMAFKPKHRETERDAEEARARAEIQMMRGDIPPGTSLDEQLGVTPEETVSSGNNAAPAASEFDEPEIVQPEPAMDDPDLVMEPTEIGSESSENTEKKSAGQEESQDSTPLTEMEVERLQMVRFLGDSLLTLRDSQDQLDSATRFGMGLYLAGATSELADKHGLTPVQERDILCEALYLIGHSKVMTESFLDKIDSHETNEKNQSLIKAGQSAMAKHLRSKTGTEHNLTDTIDLWKKQGLAQPAPLGDVFLLTHVLNAGSGPTRVNTDVLEGHNRMVRTVLEENSGTEVRHTGKGIFASFKHPDDAICAAIAIQQKCSGSDPKTNDSPKLCVGLIGSQPHESDPAVSGEVFTLANALCRRLRAGQIACDSMVREATGIETIEFGGKIQSAHSGIPEKISAFEVIYEPQPA